MCVGSKHTISSRRFFFPESCVRQFAETSGKDTFTAWAWRGSPPVGLEGMAVEREGLVWWGMEIDGVLWPPLIDSLVTT
jgi:hypothetical protein